MTLNSHFALNTVLRVESFSVYALVLRHDSVKIDGDVHILSAAKCRVCGHMLTGEMFTGQMLTGQLLTGQMLTPLSKNRTNAHKCVFV